MPHLILLMLIPLVSNTQDVEKHKVQECSSCSVIKIKEDLIEGQSKRLARLTSLKDTSDNEFLKKAGINYGIAGTFAILTVMSSVSLIGTTISIGYVLRKTSNPYVQTIAGTIFAGHVLITLSNYLLFKFFQTIADSQIDYYAYKEREN